MFEMFHRAKFGKNRFKRGRDMAIFQFFKMAAAAILDFENFKFLTVGAVKNFELHRYVKFRRNSSLTWPRYGVLDFSRWQPPPSWIFKISNF